MKENSDWESMPLNPDVRRYIKATRDYAMEERATILRFAPMLCRCQPWYDWRFPVAPQADCMIHTAVLFDRDGEWMLRDAVHEFTDLAGGLGPAVFGVQVGDDDRVGYLP